METFETLLEKHRSSVERFVKFRIAERSDAEDVLQEVYLAAYQKFGQLRKPDAFKAWILRIAQNKCNDFFRQASRRLEIPIDAVAEQTLVVARHGIAPMSAVEQTLELLGEKEKQILYLHYWKELPQAEIARRLQLPLGTVKSRLYTAKRKFQAIHPHPNDIVKGASPMKKLPVLMPEYQIEPLETPPFSVKWEELMGWFLIPKLGEKLSWGMYDMPSGRCSHTCDMQVTGRAIVHGIEGVELTAQESSCSNPDDVSNWTFVAQMTDTHCRYLAAIRKVGEVRNYLTFLDGDAFMPNWGFGEDNCGNETNLSPKGDIHRQGSCITSADKAFLLDIVGRYAVTISGRTYDTVCVMDIETYNGGVVSEQFLDSHGRTILWRRFNRDDWALERYHKKWTEQLPHNQRLTVNGKTYVHWYDCISDYIL